MAIEKLPNHSNPGLQPSTNSVRPTILPTDADRARQSAGLTNDFRNQQNQAGNNRQPGNSPYGPRS